jgi:serine/threonine protein phosphatase PrpC
VTGAGSISASQLLADTLQTLIACFMGIACTQITCVRRRDEDMLLILASDGLWDVFTNQEARDFAVDK